MQHIMALGSAPGKLILCGEHAVVYSRPAIALPLGSLRARVSVDAAPDGAGVRFEAPDLADAWTADDVEQPLATLYTLAARRLGLARTTGFVIRLSSAIPVAAGLGSGAAIGAALVRALAAYAGEELSAAEVAALVWESERMFHGTPSGIDNTVVSYEQAIWYRRGAGEPPGAPTIEPLVVGAPIRLVIADTGVRAPTRTTVGRVREGWLREPGRFEALFDAIAEAVAHARGYLASGDGGALGRVIDRNQMLLEQLGVSSPELERLVAAARGAGALGAKLSGGGGGGVMFALVDDSRAGQVAQALYKAGAVRVLTSSAP